MDMEYRMVHPLFCIYYDAQIIMRYCVQPGCGVLVGSGRCSVHARTREQARGNLAIRKLYKTDRWERLRLRVLVESAYQCAQCGDVTVRLEVDHIRPHRGDLRSFWDRSNLQALCVACHTRKTTRGE